MEILYLVKEFIDKISRGKIEIYNEASVQYELAIFLRARLKNYKIQLERNVTCFDINKKGLVKKEIDVVIFKKWTSPGLVDTYLLPQEALSNS